MDGFEESYQQLNARQKEAVDTIDGPVLVIAGPGTGKTQLLSVRVANILQKTDTEPQNILCLTFTNKAALNMRERLSKLAGPEARKVQVRTFHSFAADIMNQYPDYFWSGARLSVAPDAVQEDIIQTILADLPQNNPLATFFAGKYTALPNIKEGLKLAKEAGLKPEELRDAINENIEYIDTIEQTLAEILSATLSIKKLPELIEQIKELPEQPTKNKFLLPLSQVLQESLEAAVEQDLVIGKTTQTGKWKRRWIQTVQGNKAMFDERKRNEWWLAVADVYEKYRDLLHERGYYDYSDMLVEVLEQLQKQPDMLADVQERFLYVLIDEFQDTNAAQLRLAHLVADHYAANNRPNIMAVGDDDQSIFAFNGAELNNMLHFITSYPDTKVIVLEDNYRSTQAILDASSKVIQLAQDRLVHRQPGLTKGLRAQRTFKEPSHVSHRRYPTIEHQYFAIAQTIKSLWDEGQTDIAVLARKHGSLRAVASILQSQNVPIRYEQQSNVLEHEAVAQICLIARVVAAISDGSKDDLNVGLAQMLKHPMWELSPKVLWDLALQNYSAPDYFDSLLSSENPRLQAIGNWLAWLSRTYSTLPLPLFLEYVIGLSEGEYMQSPLRDYYLSSPKLTSAYIETLSAVELLISLVREFASREQASLADFVRFIELNLSTQRVIANQTWFASAGSAVELLTVHKAKGLEYEHIFLVDAIESTWSPRSGGRKSPANLHLQSYGEQDDDYVRLLFVAATRAKRALYISSYSHDEKGSELLSTPLISFLPAEVVSEPTESVQEVLEASLHWPVLAIEDEKQLLHDRLENFALSPTALIDFLNIVEAGPSTFMERHLLRLPHAQSVDGKYGTAIHESLETAQRLVNTAKLDIDPVIDRFEKSLEQQHLAPRDLKRLKTRGENLLPKLLEHADILLPKSAKSEQKIEATLESGAHIKGKLDAIVENKDSVLINDFKTGKPLSSFVTKDKTKVIKAWRHQTQLLFYALLVQESGRYKTNQISTQMLYVEAESPDQMVLGLTPGPADLDRLRTLITKVYERIQNLDFPDTSTYEQNLEGIKAFEDDLINDAL